MKIYSGKNAPDGVNRETAQGCMASNLALPGLGSLAGGRKIGLFQLGLCFAGFGLTLGFGVPFVSWALSHWSEIYGAGDLNDPFKPLRDIWRQARWSLLGILLFAVSWSWALLTSRSILAEAKVEKPTSENSRQ